MSLFKKPTAGATKRFKLFIFGPSGSGKTWTSLHFPSPAIIDPDGGAEWYEALFPNMERLVTSDIEQIHLAIDEKIAEPGDTKTIILDTVTKYWELLQEKHIKRLRVKKGNPQYALQGMDWGPIKSDLKFFINKLNAIDMNIVVIAQVKPEYSAEQGEFMKVIGTTFDGPKNMPYMFDTVIELKLEDDKRMAYVHKDRTNKLPVNEPFEFSYEALTKYLDVKELERESVKLRTDQNMGKTSNRTTSTEFNGKTILTAGVSGETIEKIVSLVTDGTVGESELADKLLTDYQVAHTFDLREDEARLLINDLTNKK